MINLNEVWVGGNMTRDPELRYVGAKNTPVVSFGVAVNASERIKGEDQRITTYFNCEAWFGDAEHISKEFKKGSEIVCIGQMRNEKWEKDGIERTRDKIKVARYARSIAELTDKLVDNIEVAQSEEASKTKAEVVVESNGEVPNLPF